MSFRYIATELCSGTLADLVSGRYTGPSVGSRSEVLVQVLKGVEHLHLLNIIHGDLKPTNILISIPSGAVGPMIKLTDFGLRHCFSSFGDQNREFTAACTKSWKAPESELTFASDMFCFGLVCGFSLSDGPDWENIKRINSYITSNLTADQLNHVGGSAAAQVFQLIQTLLSKKADDRPTAYQVLKHAFFSDRNVTFAKGTQKFLVATIFLFCFINFEIIFFCCRSSTRI